ncbi:MAG: hypothetical protein IPK00_13770 [Deltaproteobacteria bacterium]|nr:hypothetical protein [Deltaproteobacteria bacterium]
MLLIVVGAAYANAFAASFQFDDWDVIVRDPRVQSLTAWWDSMPGIRPLLKLGYALNHASGLGAVGFHAVNVAIHAVNALLAYAIVRALAARHGPGPKPGPGPSTDPGTGPATRESSIAGSSAVSTTAAASTTSTDWLALVAGLVFALHPVQTEAVTYASGRSTSLSTGLALASLLVWARAWERAGRSPGGGFGARARARPRRRGRFADNRIRPRS